MLATAITGYDLFGYWKLISICFLDYSFLISCVNKKIFFGPK